MTETTIQKRWLAWAALNAEGTPVAASVRNNPVDVPVIVEGEGPIKIVIEIVGEPVREYVYTWQMRHCQEQSQ